MLSALIQSWTTYSKKLMPIAILVYVSMIKLVLVLLPYVNNIVNTRGFIPGFLLGFVLLLKPRVGKMAQGKGALFEYEVKCSAKLRKKLDRSTCSVSFRGINGRDAVAVFCGVNTSEYCWWCSCFLWC